MLQSFGKESTHQINFVQKLIELKIDCPSKRKEYDLSSDVNGSLAHVNSAHCHAAKKV